MVHIFQGESSRVEMRKSSVIKYRVVWIGFRKQILEEHNNLNYDDAKEAFDQIVQYVKDTQA